MQHSNTNLGFNSKPSPILCLQGLSVAPVLHNINCSVNAGEILTIIGPNGAGKSTLLKAILGDAKISDGSINIQNKDTLLTRSARQIASLPQLSLLNFPYRVVEVVNLARIPHQTGNVIDQLIIDEVLSAMDISELKERYYTQLSGGEKQRVQLARVLAQIWREEDAPSGTRLLLLDEPTTALDLGHQQQLMTAVRQFSKQGIAVIMVLHDINLAARFSDKILALLDGESVAYGAVNDVVCASTMQQLFNIQTQINFHPQSNTPYVIGLEA